jgi:hypothetical protein
MRKLILLTIAVFTLNSAFTQSNIPNGDLEDWYQITVSGSVSYFQPGVPNWNNFLSSLNDLVAVPPPIGPGPETVQRTTDKYSGTYAAKLISASFPISDSVTVFIPGMLGTAQMDYANIGAKVGKGCPGCRPLQLTGYYKAAPVNGDSCSIVILVSQWNTATHKKDTIGFGRMVEHNQVTTYTRFELPVVYNPELASVVPDSLTILCVASAGYSVINFMGGVGQDGSTMFIDELMLEYPAGIQQSLMPDVMVNCFPNPAKDVMNVQLSELVKNGTLEVYDLNGKRMGSYPMPGIKGTITVGSFADGTYFFKLKQENHVLNTGSFMVKK